MTNSMWRNVAQICRRQEGVGRQGGGRKNKINWPKECDATCLTSGKASRASWFNYSSKTAENWEIEERHVKGKRSRLSHWFLLFLGRKNEINWQKKYDATCLTSGKARRTSWFNRSNTTPTNAEDWEIEEEGHVKEKGSTQPLNFASLTTKFAMQHASDLAMQASRTWFNCQRLGWGRQAWALKDAKD